MRLHPQPLCIPVVPVSAATSPSPPPCMLTVGSMASPGPGPPGCLHTAKSSPLPRLVCLRSSIPLLSFLVVRALAVSGWLTSLPGVPADTLSAVQFHHTQVPSFVSAQGDRVSARISCQTGVRSEPNQEVLLFGLGSAARGLSPWWFSHQKKKKRKEESEMYSQPRPQQISADEIPRPDHLLRSLSALTVSKPARVLHIIRV